MKKLIGFIKNEEGVTAIEYGFLAALLALVCIGIWTTMGPSVLALFTPVNGTLH